jgi:hypothetical protein
MRSGRRRRMRLKSKHGRTDKRHKPSRRMTTHKNDVTQIEVAHSLLLSSLRFWEVERDLIEERIAAIGR